VIIFSASFRTFEGFCLGGLDPFISEEGGHHVALERLALAGGPVSALKPILCFILFFLFLVL
jgi:hypothetical protein